MKHYPVVWGSFHKPLRIRIPSLKNQYLMERSWLICCQPSSFAQFLQPKLSPHTLGLQEGFLIGAHHGLELSDVDRVCELLIMKLRWIFDRWAVVEWVLKGEVEPDVIWVVATQIFFNVHAYLGKMNPFWTHLFQMGWFNHQPVIQFDWLKWGEIKLMQQMKWSFSWNCPLRNSA